MVFAVYTKGMWRASVAIPGDILEYLRQVAHDWLPPERYVFITEINMDGSDGTTTLDFEVESSGEDVHQLAEEEWTRLLAIAGLDTLPPAFVGFLPPAWEVARHEELRREADDFMAQASFDLAVVRAQTACEVLAREAIAGALRGAVGRDRGDRLSTATKAALNDRSTQQILEALTGSSPTQQPWWPDYGVHLVRRNQIVHAGREVTRAEARGSLDAVDHCMGWLKDIWSGRVARMRS